MNARLPLAEAMEKYRDQNGVSLAELSRQQPRLVVFLRHSGCTFCREALDDIKRQRTGIEAKGMGIVLVSMSDDAAAQSFFGKYGLDDLPRVSDPGRDLYSAFDLNRGGFWQLLGPSVWFRGAKAFFGGHGVGKIEGDVRQMPGTFVIADGRIVKAHPYKTAGDRPDYAAFAESCPVTRP